MNLKNLSKEQKQYMTLGALAVVILAGIIGFGIKVSLSSITTAKMELLDVSSKVGGAERALAQQDQIHSDLDSSTAVLKEHLRDAPPVKNYDSWAPKVIYEEARLAGLDIDSIDQQPRIQVETDEAKNKPLTLESYLLRIGAHGGFADLKNFLERLEEHHPLARVIAVDISTGPDPEIHAMQLQVQWPFNLDKVEAAQTDIKEVKQAVEASVNKGQDPSSTSGKIMPVPPPPRPASMNGPTESQQE